MTDEVPLEDFTLTRSVQTSSGKLQGFKDEANQVDVFLGIPYAEPPVGSLRFRPTVPLDTPNIERTCTAHAPAAPQTAMPFDTLMCVEINYQSEDCLYLNVWRPSHSSTDKPKPVIVWFHPGALGWMSMGHISSDLKESANLGLLDQITALKWVQKNIASFGGDSNNVTAFGSSAGATCIMSLILSPHTAGLFRRVVLQSPPMFMVSPKKWAEMKGSIFVRSLGLDESDLLQNLQSIDIEMFLESQTFMTTWPNFLEGLAPIGNSVDDQLLHKTVIEHFFHEPLPAGYEDLEIMIGYTRDEFNFFFPFLPNFQEMDDSMFVRTYFTHVFGYKNNRQAYELYKQDIVPPMSPPSEVARYMCSDVMSRMATLLTAENLSRHGHKVYLYQWNYESNDVQNVIKAAHMVDSIFSWDNLVYWTDNPFLGPGDDHERDRIAKQISGAIAQFAKTGDPNRDGLPLWPLHNEEERSALIFDSEVYSENNIYQTGVHLWKTVLKDYVVNTSFPIKPKENKKESSKDKDLLISPETIGPSDKKRKFEEQ
ncbi:hypothetical protein G6F43_003976 [Rhizopus delemar]|nr:hypothetical protein G6F43_003976 [Rhizopus delemar]